MCNMIKAATEAFVLVFEEIEDSQGLFVFFFGCAALRLLATRRQGQH